MEETKFGLVISAFPGCGKSYFTNVTVPEANKISRKKFYVTDSDSSHYSWIVDENYEKKRNPNFPNNYIEHIKEERKTNDIVLVSTHKEVRNALEEAGIEYSLVYPDKSMKAEFIGRYFLRGSDISFLHLLADNWDTWIDEMESTESNIIRQKIILKDDKKYLSDVIKVITVHKTE